MSLRRERSAAGRRRLRLRRRDPRYGSRGPVPWTRGFCQNQRAHGRTSAPVPIALESNPLSAVRGGAGRESRLRKRREGKRGARRPTRTRSQPRRRRGVRGSDGDRRSPPEPESGPPSLLGPVPLRRPPNEPPQAAQGTLTSPCLTRYSPSRSTSIQNLGFLTGEEYNRSCSNGIRHFGATDTICHQIDTRGRLTRATLRDCSLNALR